MESDSNRAARGRGAFATPSETRRPQRSSPQVVFIPGPGGSGSAGLSVSALARPQSLRSVKRKGFRVVMDCSKTCFYELRLVRRGKTYARGTGRVRGDKRTVTLRLSAKGKGTLRRGVYSVRGTLSDAAGTERRLKVGAVIR